MNKISLLGLYVVVACKTRSTRFFPKWLIISRLTHCPTRTVSWERNEKPKETVTSTVCNLHPSESMPNAGRQIEFPLVQ
ncbi:hypothetical protein AFLA_013499 [Aspergillus flavus NRRL3357]|nr:hypothetical protein AFLA_013499 [Aspergillus flavus NRRL3357]